MTGAGELMVECLSQARSDVQQGKKARGIEATAMAQSSTDDVIVIRSNRFEYLQKTDWVLQLRVSAADETRGIEKVSLHNVFERALQFERGALHQKFGSLMHNLESEFVFVK